MLVAIVEDDRNQKTLIKRALSDAAKRLEIQLDIIEMGDGLDLLLFLKDSIINSTSCYNLAIVDIRLNSPSNRAFWDGTKGISECNSLYLDLRPKFIIYSSSSDTEDIKAGYKSGAIAYVVKNFDQLDRQLESFLLCELTTDPRQYLEKNCYGFCADPVEEIAQPPRPIEKEGGMWGAVETVMWLVLNKLSQSAVVFLAILCLVAWAIYLIFN